LKKNEDKAKRVRVEMEESQRNTCHGRRKTSVEERSVFKSSTFRSPFYILLLSVSELGIPKRRQFPSELAASLFVAKATVEEWHKN
jgi:hypothetical protein